MMLGFYLHSNNINDTCRIPHLAPVKDEPKDEPRESLPETMSMKATQKAPNLEAKVVPSATPGAEEWKVTQIQPRSPNHGIYRCYTWSLTQGKNLELTQMCNLEQY